MKLKFSIAILFQFLGFAAGLTPFLYSYPEGTSIRDFTGSALILGISTIAFFGLALPSLLKVLKKEENQRFQHFLVFIIAGSVLFTALNVWSASYEAKGYEMSD